MNKIGEIGANGFYYDPAAWAQPTASGSATRVPNQFRGPGGWNLDLSVFRSFRLSGTHRLEARVEAANVTNTTKFANPTNSFTSGDFMRIFASVQLVRRTAGAVGDSLQLLILTARKRLRRRHGLRSLLARAVGGRRSTATNDYD